MIGLFVVLSIYFISWGWAALRTYSQCSRFTRNELRGPRGCARSNLRQPPARQAPSLLHYLSSPRTGLFLICLVPLSWFQSLCALSQAFSHALGPGSLRVQATPPHLLPSEPVYDLLPHLLLPPLCKGEPPSSSEAAEDISRRVAPRPHSAYRGSGPEAEICSLKAAWLSC